MKDAFGGAFMIKVFLVFIIVYVILTAVALNYAKAFKVKNMVINYIEENELQVLDMTALDEQKLENFFNTEIVGTMNYRVQMDRCPNSAVSIYEDNKMVGYCHPAGILIQRAGDAENTDGAYYRVNTYFSWDLGFLKILTKLNGNNKDQSSSFGKWTISGETRVLVQE